METKRENHHEFLTKPLRRLLFVFVFIGLVVIFYGAERGREHMSNRVIDWLPSGFQETHDFNWFLQHFYEGELLMVSWDGCAPNDERLEEIARRLTAPTEDGKPPLYWKAVTTGDIMANLMDEPMNLTEEEAQDRMFGWILSKDGNQGCLVAYLSEEGYKDTHLAIDEIRQITSEVSGMPDEAIHIAGTSLDSVAIDDTSKGSQQRLLPFFLATCVLMLFILLRSWKAVFVIFVAAIFNEELSCALIYYTGNNTDSISLLSSSLVFVLTISGGLHLLNYYHDFMERSGKEGAALKAMDKAAIPCGLACLTTVLGLFSLTVSQVAPIRRFGLFSTLALILGTIFFFIYIGAFIEHYPIRSWMKSRNPSRFSMKSIWVWFPEIILRHRRFFAWSSLLTLVVFAFFLPRLQTTVTFHGMFPPDARVIQDYNYLEDRIGGLIPIEVVINIPRETNSDATPLDQVAFLDAIDAKLWEIHGVESTLSALNFVPFIPELDANDFGATVERSVFNKMMERRQEDLVTACLYDGRPLPIDQMMGFAPAERWRISLRVNAKSSIAYGPFIQEIRSVVDQAVAENQERFGLADVSTMITGGIPLVHKAQKQLLDDLSSSYLSAFALILITLIFLLRGILPGMIAMIPNIFPSVVVFGFMGATGRSVDMGTMMTASVALGISVDGTIHFLTWYRQALSEGKSREEAVKFGYRECGTAMVQATIVCGGGMLIFALSRFLPISRFAWMMAILLVIALFGDLVLFPALLYGPLGRCFYPRLLRQSIRDGKKGKNRSANPQTDVLGAPSGSPVTNGANGVTSG